jgi:steroid delta-isomerase-like uncharacterized protein
MFYKFISVFIVAVFSFACIGVAFAGDKDEANMVLMKKFYAQVANKGNIDLIDDLCAENFIEHEELPGFEPTRDGVKQFFKMYRKAFPDLKFKTEFMFAADDKVVTYLTISGTHKGEFLDMKATGKKINLKGIDIVRFSDGKAVEHWGITDTMAMMHQLGAIPEGDAPKSHK